MANLPTFGHPPPASTGDDYYTLMEAWMTGQDDASGNLQTLENRVEGLSNLIVGTGLVADTFTPPLLSAGTGLSVNIDTFQAIVGIPIDHSGAGSVLGGLTPSDTNTIFLKQDGSYTSNTTGTNGGSTANPWIELGTATTDATSVTGVTDTYDVLPLPIGTTGIIPVGGDLSGTVAAATVIGIQGNPIPVPTTPDDGYVLAWNDASGAYEWVPPDTGIPGGGTVTSVGITVPSWLTVSGSPVTTTGTLAVSAAGSQPANRVLATPDSSVGAVSLRALAVNDIPVQLGNKISGGTFGAVNATNLTNLDGADVVGNIPGNAANVTGVVAVVNGGTGGNDNTTGYDNLSPMTTLGDLVTHDGTHNVRLLGNITVTRKFLRQVGTGSVSAAPVWDTLLAADIPTISGSQVSGGTFGAVNGSALTNLMGANVTGNISGNAANVTGTVLPSHGGTGQITAAAGFNALSPLTTLGDLLYGGTSGAGTRLGGNTTTAKQFLTQTGTGSASAAPAWAGIVAADVPTLDGSKISGGTLGVTSGVNLTNLTAANLTGQVSVPHGGTGAATLPATLLQGNGTSAITGVTVGTGLSLSAGVLTSTASFTNTVGETVVVAASNSIDPTRADAAYRCTGTGDQVKIIAAINLAASIGAEVKLLEGSYSLAAPITIAHSNVTLRGSGWGTLISRGYNDAANGAMIKIGDGTNSYSNISILDLQLDGVKTTWTSSNNIGIYLDVHTTGTLDAIRIENVQVKNCSGSAIYAGGIVNRAWLKVETNGNVVGFNSALSGSSTGVALDGCRFVGDVTGVILTGPNSTLTRSRIESTTGTGAYPSGVGISVEGVTRGMIDSCLIANCSRSGIQGTTDSTGIKIKGNRVHACHDFGMSLNLLTDATLENNTVTSTAQFSGANGTGVFLNNCTRVTLSDNALLDNVGYGLAIALSSSTTELQDNRISGNTLGQILNSSTTSLFLGQSDGTDFVTSGEKISAAGGLKLPGLTSADGLATDSGGNVIAAVGMIPIGGAFEWYVSPTSLPANYKVCDGSLLAVASYPALFALLGYSQGGSGASFALPDRRDRFGVGASGTKAVSSTGGSDTHSHNVSGSVAGAQANISDHAAHTHSFATSGDTSLGGGGISGGVTLTGGGPYTVNAVTSGSLNHVHGMSFSGTTGSTGPQAHSQSNHAHSSGTLAADSVTALPKYTAVHVVMRVS